MILDSGQPGDERRDARQRPQLGGEAVRPRAPKQGPLDAAQLPPIEPGLAAQPARRFQPLAPPAPPAVIPLMRRLSPDSQSPHHGGLPNSPRKQPCGLEAAGFQRGHIPVSPWCLAHPSAWHGTR